MRDLTTVVQGALGKEWTLMVNPGDVAPAFDVQDEQGNRRTLDEFRGKRLLLWFYPKADTPG